MKKFDLIWIPRGLAILNFFLFISIYFLSLEIRLLGVAILLMIAIRILIYGKRNVALYYFLTSLGAIIIYFLLIPFSSKDFIYFINFNMLLTLSFIISIINTNLIHIFLWKPNQKVGNFKLENPRKIWNCFDMWLPRIVLLMAIIINLAYVYTKFFILYKIYGGVEYGTLLLLVLTIILTCFVLTFLLPISSAIFYLFFSILILYLLDSSSMFTFKIYGINLTPITFWLILMGSLMLLFAYFKSYFTYEKTVSCQSPVSDEGVI